MIEADISVGLIEFSDSVCSKSVFCLMDLAWLRLPALQILDCIGLRPAPGDKVCFAKMRMSLGVFKSRPLNM